MKWIFIGLFAANLIYFGWELDRQTRINLVNSREALQITSGIKHLVLVDELSTPPPVRRNQEADRETITGDEYVTGEDELLPGPESGMDDLPTQGNIADALVTELPDIIASGIPATIQPERIMCFSYGPFANENQSGELVNWFQEHGVTIRQRLESGQENQLFWIYLKPQATRDSAMQAIEDLKSKGIKDYRLIETGDLQNAISLGLFSTQASVNRRLNELKNKGYQPVVVPHRDTKAIYWLDVKLTDQQDVLNLMFTEYPARHNSVPVDCSEIALQVVNP
jgi:hypothetical protein